MSTAARNTLIGITVAATLGLALAWTGLGAQTDLWAYDWFLRLSPPPAAPSHSLIVSIDEESLAKIGGVQRLREPLARALRILADHDPAVVAIDVVLSEDRDEAENLALEQALAALPKVVLAANLRAAGGAWEKPLDRFERAAAALGHVHAEPDFDGVCRRLLLAKATGRERYWALALEAYRLASGAQQIAETTAGLELGASRIPAPLDEQRALRILFPNPNNPIERLPLIEVLENPEAAAVVRGRAVFVGVQVLGGLDRYLMTPYSFGAALNGVEINAGAYETLARGAYLKSAPPSLELALTLTLLALLAICFLRLHGIAAVVAAAIVLLAAHALPFVFFHSGQVYSFSQPVFVAWLGFLAGSAFHYLGVRGLWRQAESETSRYRRAVHYVTHEMRTPLTTIQGSSELISRYALSDEKRREMADLIHTESQRLARMVDLFLGVERLSTGQLELKRAPVPVDDLLTGCIERGRSLAERKNIAIQFSPLPGILISGDREFLEYACYNLISNAVKYSPAHTQITVRARQQGDRVSISVEDRGYGMDENELRNIFRRFYRTQSAETSGEPGSGLGLALVEEIIVQHGGSIEVESRVNHGSRFTVSLPAAPADPTPAQAGRERTKA